MIDHDLTRRLLHWALFIALAATLVFIRILPLSTAPRVIPGPDLLICLAFAWVQRRPDYLPPLLLGAVMFLADIVMMRPPGLWAVLVIVGAEFLRSRHSPGAEMPFVAEWGLMAVVTLAITALYAMILGLLGVGGVLPTLLLVQAFLTVTLYPLVVAFTVGILNIRKPGQLELERAGQTR